MRKRIIPLLAAAAALIFSSCSYITTTVEKTASKKNTNKSNNISVNKKKLDDDIVLSPYYEPVEMTAGYDCLDTYNEKRLYNAVSEHAADFADGTPDGEGNYTITTIKLYDCDISEREISKAFFAVELDRPDIFWLAAPYSYTISSKGEFTLTLSSHMSYDEYRKSKGQLNSVINSVLKGLEPKMSELERELYIHDYLIKNCVYLEKAKKNNFSRYTIYGCLVEQSAVCEGYTNAFQLLLSYCGIMSVPVSGSLEDSDNIDHVWSAVKIDGDYYYTDVTWDDAEDIVMYDYFNLTTKQLLHSHSIAPLFDDPSKGYNTKSEKILNYNLIIPDCNATKYNYYRYFGSELNSMSDNSLVSDLAEAARYRDEFFYISVGKGLNFTTIYDQLFSDDIFLFAGYIDDANSQLGEKVLKNSVSVLKRKWLRTIIVELKYNE